LTLAATIKKALASLSRRDNHRCAATAHHPILIAALSIQMVAQYRPEREPITLTITEFSAFRRAPRGPETL